MSEISNLLTTRAHELRESCGLVGDDSWDLVKSAAVGALAEKGVDITDAEILVNELAKKAGYGETRSVANAFPFDANDVLTLIEKSAEYVGELEAKIGSLEDELEKAANANNEDIISALIEKGFSEEDASNLVALPSETLDKVASFASGEPWEMGKGGRIAEDSLDPLTKFLMS